MKNLFEEQAKFHKKEFNTINTKLIIGCIVFTFLLLTILI